MIKAVKLIYAQFGFWGTVESYLLKFLKRLRVEVRREIMYSINLESIEPKPISPMFKVLDSNDIEAFSRGVVHDTFIDGRIKRLHTASQRYQERSEDKELFIPMGIIIDGMPVSFLIIRNHSYGGGPLFFMPKLNEHQCYTFDNFTHPQYRRHGYCHLNYLNTIQYMKSLGYNEIIAFVAGFNKASHYNFRKAGFEPKKKILVWKIGKSGKAMHISYQCR